MLLGHAASSQLRVEKKDKKKLPTLIQESLHRRWPFSWHSRDHAGMPLLTWILLVGPGTDGLQQKMLRTADVACLRGKGVQLPLISDTQEL